MQRMDNMFSRPFDRMPMLEDGRGRERMPGRDRDRPSGRDRDRPSGSRDLAPFDSGFGFGNMFADMNAMMGRVMQDTERAFVSMRHDMKKIFIKVIAKNS